MATPEVTVSIQTAGILLSCFIGVIGVIGTGANIVRYFARLAASSEHVAATLEELKEDVKEGFREVRETIAEHETRISRMEGGKR